MNTSAQRTRCESMYKETISIIADIFAKSGVVIRCMSVMLGHVSYQSHTQHIPHARHFRVEDISAEGAEEGEVESAEQGEIETIKITRMENMSRDEERDLDDLGVGREIYREHFENKLLGDLYVCKEALTRMREEDLLS
jgi:hypothetical protein